MSRVNFGAKPVMYPMPVLIIATYDENGVPDAMNAAWGIITDMNEISISMSEHKDRSIYCKYRNRRYRGSLRLCGRGICEEST